MIVRSNVLQCQHRPNKYQCTTALLTTAIAQCRLHSDAWMHELPARVLTRLLAPRLRLTEMARRAMAETLEWCMQSATEPEAPIYWPPGAPAYRHYKGSEGGRPIERDTIRWA